MRILHVISSLDRLQGGPPVALAGLAIAQAKLGATVSVAATFSEAADHHLEEQLRQADVAVMMIGPATGKFQRHPQIKPVLASLIAGADFVHIHAVWEEIQHQAAATARRHRKPYAFTPHGMLDPWSLSQSQWRKRAYLAVRLRRDLNGAKFIHALNADEAKLIEPLQLRTLCEIIPNGFDPTALNLPAADGNDREGEPYLLFLSRLHPKKGLDYLADAFAIVAEQRPDVRLIVAGPDDGAGLDFDARIAVAGLQKRAQRVGPLYGQDKTRAFAGASIFVLPSRQEGFSVAILEALACGAPVVISQPCHFPEVAERGAGKIVALTPAAIAEGILQLLNDRSARERASEAAKRLAGEYTWDRIAQRSIDLYGKPTLAILANSMTPYRVALHRRIARELSGIQLQSLFTDAQSNAPWEIDPPKEIGPVSFVSIGNSWKQGGAIRAWIDRNRPAAVIVNGYNNVAHLRVIRACAQQGVPCFLWGDSNIRGDRASGIKAIVKSAVVRWAIRRSSGVMVCGSLGQKYFEKYGAEPNRIFVMPYEPDYELIRQLPPETITRVGQRFGFDPRRRRIVYSGRLIPIKRVDLLLRTFADIANQRADWDLVIIGQGPLQADLQSLVPAAQTSRVTWTGFIDDQTVISALYRNADVLVHPADIEPWGLVINEAAAAGMAIVASDQVGAAAELVRDGVNGRIFRAGDLADLRRALLEVTAADQITRLKTASAEVLSAWQSRADPVTGIGRALASIGFASDAKEVPTL